MCMRPHTDGDKIKLLFNQSQSIQGSKLSKSTMEGIVCDLVIKCRVMLSMHKSMLKQSNLGMSLILEFIRLLAEFAQCSFLVTVWQMS